ncbi:MULTISPECIES: putative zinc ribbon protein [unclassified Serratia (in: enterobacteria)]|uniref:putative zinc ribbon protein n=1 Tax=unclassified Serratia (in: enterobacteria) TaxID=2647522 RepID=UPI0004FF8466|nr:MULTISPECIES: putative zinc ribbon protein [unclassified Serratia (in: enterobacteria)]KFK91676.1 hypothetical protein JV45_25005 [Serratia sp. Ag2]KFK92591.1 hypothetical protein IV04_24600 [Serratia sp. Ag1]
MYAKSFIALDSHNRLIGARTAQTAPDDRYCCHLCGSAMRFHPDYQTERPWFEHRQNTLTAQGRECPYVQPDREERRYIKMLRRYVPDAHPIVRKADWFCLSCNTGYYGERYCLVCQTGEHSTEVMADL